MKCKAYIIRCHKRETNKKDAIRYKLLALLKLTSQISNVGTVFMFIFFLVNFIFFGFGIHLHLAVGVSFAKKKTRAFSRLVLVTIFVDTQVSPFTPPYINLKYISTIMREFTTMLLQKNSTNLYVFPAPFSYNGTNFAVRIKCKYILCFISLLWFVIGIIGGKKKKKLKHILNATIFGFCLCQNFLVIIFPWHIRSCVDGRDVSAIFVGGCGSYSMDLRMIIIYTKVRYNNPQISFAILRYVPRWLECSTLFNFLS